MMGELLKQRLDIGKPGYPEKKSQKLTMPSLPREKYAVKHALPKPST